MTAPRPPYPQAKRDGLECRVWYCGQQNPRHAITWKCENGHREDLWYCGGHIAEMMKLASEGRMGCHVCRAWSTVVMEGANTGA